MIEIMLSPPMDSILFHLYYSTPDNAVYDIIFCILAVTILLLIDIILRFVIELVEYNKAVVDEQALPLCHSGNKEVYICRNMTLIYM